MIDLFITKNGILKIDEIRELMNKLDLLTKEKCKYKSAYMTWSFDTHGNSTWFIVTLSNIVLIPEVLKLFKESNRETKIIVTLK